jgi:Domain of unknown function (DUF4279)
MIHFGDNQMPQETTMYLVIMGFEQHPDVITMDLGVKPSQTWLKGDRVEDSQITRKFNGWELESGLDKAQSAQAHLQGLMRIVSTNRDQFRHICSKYDGQVSCAIFASSSGEENFVPFYLDRESIRLCAEVGLEINCEFYPTP